MRGLIRRTIGVEGFLAVLLREGVLGTAHAKGEIAAVAAVRLRAHAGTCSHAARIVLSSIALNFGLIFSWLLDPDIN